jgi:HPt (histidine-containing phosphotransfer) domain-containing protein
MDCSMNCSTTFDEALESYLGNLPKEKKQLKFIELCRALGTVDPAYINELIQQQEARRTLSKPMKNLMHRLTGALKDYSEVIGQFGK